MNGREKMPTHMRKYKQICRQAIVAILVVFIGTKAYFSRQKILKTLARVQEPYYPKQEKLTGPQPQKPLLPEEKHAIPPPPIEEAKKEEKESEVTPEVQEKKEEEVKTTPPKPTEPPKPSKQFVKKRINLSDSNWKLSSVDPRQSPPKDISIEAKVPGDVYLAMFEAKQTPDPYLESNDVDLRWIANQNWTYERKFEVETLGPATLVLLGVDTVSSIYINKDLVGTTDNMFHQYYFDISSSLAQGENQIRVVFSSTIAYAKQQHDAFHKQYGYSPPPSCPPGITHGVCHANFIRKMQASFSWDWGPAFPTMGFHKDLWVEMSQPCFIDSVSGVPTFLKPQNRWILHAEMFLYCHGTDFGADRAGKVLVPELKFDEAWLVKGSELKVGLNPIYKSFLMPENPDLKLWWPNGYGDQRMYKMEVSVVSGTKESQILQMETKIAFRSVELVQEPIPANPTGITTDGLTFYFRVNSLPIFLKGTNWIPADSFQTRITEDKLRFLFKSMREVNMNAMRVWGGGVYEPDVFYDLADQHGILIWQDMMFACASYPGNPEFIESAKFEVQDQIRRLKRHPSILVWAGNNENDGHKGRELDKDYLKLYKETIWKVVNESDFQSRPYVLASPSNGIKTVEEGGISSNPGNPKFGDVHFYNYHGNAWDHRTFPTPRCSSEYGYQSLPAAATLKTAIPKEEDWSYFSAAMEHRQHHMGGTNELVDLPLRHFKTPRCVSDEGKGAEYVHGKQFLKTYCPNTVEKDQKKAEALFLEDLIYLNQIHQARAYQTETEHYRRFRNRTNPTSGVGYTMCALYWQLNDIWQAPTWSTIDWGLRWKMAHYYAKDFFAPLIVSPYIENEQLFIALSSDLERDLSDLKIIVDLIPWKHEFKPTHTFNISVASAPAFTSKIFYNQSMESLCKSAARNSTKNDSSLKLEDLVIRIQLVNSTMHAVAPEQVVLTTDFRNVNPESYGKVSVEDARAIPGSENQFEVKLRSSGIAPYVWLEMKSMMGYFDRNGFTMTREKATVIFNSWTKKTVEEIKGELGVKSLGDLYP